MRRTLRLARLVPQPSSSVRAPCGPLRFGRCEQPARRLRSTVGVEHRRGRRGGLRIVDRNTHGLAKLVAERERGPDGGANGPLTTPALDRCGRSPAAPRRRSQGKTSRSATRLDGANTVHRHDVGANQVATRRSSNIVATAMRERERRPRSSRKTPKSTGGFCWWSSTEPEDCARGNPLTTSPQSPSSGVGSRLRRRGRRGRRCGLPLGALE